MTKQEEKALNELDYLNVLMYSVVKQTNVDRMDAVVWALERQSDILGSLLFPEKGEETGEIQSTREKSSFTEVAI